ncbi:v-type ATPase subunit family domain-containing protein [Ditylenchus destructor]|nr:v-type ATPase subunit family domain-containing protein [Ditylenchus destructor]
MGLFAVYTGCIYNDIFSKSLNVFDSEWRNPYKPEFLMKLIEQDERNNQSTSLEMPPEFAFQHDNGPYVFGLDPIWNLALNRLNFLNPMKMKSSIIIGICHMSFGVFLSLLNYIHVGSKIDIFFVFVPQVLFLGLIFIYLCVQVVLKWVYFWVAPKYIFGQYYPGSHCAPSLLIGLISMFMFKSREPGMAHQNDRKEWEENDQCFLQLWYPNQDTVEAIFITIAVLCIPVMLFVKPLYMWWKARRGEPVASGHGHDDNDGEFNFGDVMVYQAIHTIEFALGCISHTASYLRLWALSLAHAQLSDVLWSMVLRIALSQTGIIAIVANFIIFALFGTMSVAILVLMEGLSAFLHALRLHWVEFQSKFYAGQGVQFEPFSFHQLIRIHEGSDS